MIRGLTEELSEKTGIKCDLVKPFRGIELASDIDSAALHSMEPLMSIAVGLALREPGDRVIPEGF